MVMIRLVFLFCLFFFSGRLAADNPFHPLEILSVEVETSKGIKVSDRDMIKRLVKSYKQVASKKENRGNSMWQVFFQQRHKELHKTFMEGNTTSCARILRNPAANELFYGIDNLTIAIAPSFGNPETAKYHALISLDSLVQMVEAIGAAPNLPQIWNADNTIALLEALIGAQINFPNPYPSENGAKSYRGIISYRAPQALYQAWRIKQLVQGIENPRILEVGAGVGRTAYYARLLGITDYTIVDLPMTIMASGYFLGRTVGETNVVFPNESAVNSSSKIKFLTPEQYFFKNDTYDLIINVDSLTEMDANIAKAYWHKFEKTTPIFLSINHEGNPFTVRDLISVSTEVKHYVREHYPLRNRYFEEVVRFK